VMIWVSGTNKSCVWFNRPWLNFTGRSMNEELGDGWAQGVHAEDLSQCLQDYVTRFDAREDFRLIYRLRRHDGEYRWIDDTGIPRFARDGAFLGYIGSCVDIDEQRKIQIELQRRLQEISELNQFVDAATAAASIAEQVRQPLTSMVATAYAVRRGLDSSGAHPDNITGALDRIVDEGHRANKMIDDCLRDLSHQSVFRSR
jgi:PAS domain S-box-containing protein